MSIEISKAEQYRCCNYCGTNADVFNITFINKPNVTSAGKVTQGMQIALCKKCTKLLKTLLDVWEEDAK